MDQAQAIAKPILYLHGEICAKPFWWIVAFLAPQHSSRGFGPNETEKGRIRCK
jgi:hypothetical protein